MGSDTRPTSRAIPKVAKESNKLKPAVRSYCLPLLAVRGITQGNCQHNELQCNQALRSELWSQSCDVRAVMSELWGQSCEVRPADPADRRRLQCWWEGPHLDEGADFHRTCSSFHPLDVVCWLWVHLAVCHSAHPFVPLLPGDSERREWCHFLFDVDVSV